jgi:hypothetical protein
MNRRAFAITAMAASLAIAGCGGGGGGDAGPIASTDTYQTWAAWVNTLNEAGTRTFSISGTSDGRSLTGSGTTTFGTPNATTFEGKPALSKTTVVTGTVNVNGQSAPYGGSTVGYVDSNYRPLGTQADEYWAVTGSPTIPLTARINDTGTMYTANRYANSTKAIPLGTATVSYAVQPDSASSALLRILVTEKTTTGTTTSTTISTYRMTPAGTLTRLTEEFQSGSTALTLRY